MPFPVVDLNSVPIGTVEEIGSYPSRQDQFIFGNLTPHIMKYLEYTRKLNKNTNVKIGIEVEISVLNVKLK